MLSFMNKYSCMTDDKCLGWQIRCFYNTDVVKGLHGYKRHVELAFKVITSLGRSLLSAGSSTGDVSPTIRLSRLNPTTADSHTPWAWGIIRLYQYSRQVKGRLASSSGLSVLESSSIESKSISKAGSINKSPATSLH